VNGEGGGERERGKKWWSDPHFFARSRLLFPSPFAPATQATSKATLDNIAFSYILVSVFSSVILPITVGDFA